MELILVRHGNTFAAGDKIVWVGRNEDVPLTAEGELQAQHIAEAFCDEKISAVYCSHLLRTRRFAEIICSALALSGQPLFDDRLTEIDYGSWGGKSRDEVIAMQGSTYIEAWEKECIWPPSGIWGSTLDEIKQGVLDFCSDLVQKYKDDEHVIVVTSNGCIRFFLELLDEVPQEIKNNHGKVKTGAACSLDYKNGQYKLNYWDKRP